MIRINRPPAPDYFSSAKIENAKNDIIKQRSRKEQGRLKFNMSLLTPVKEILFRVFNEKCAYCETSVNLASYGHLDTFRPKNGSRGLNKEFSPDHYWWLAYEWSNLYPVCSICNKNKYNTFPVEADTERAPIGATGEALYAEKSLLVDPCVDEPEEHLFFEDNGMARPLTPKGHVTIDLLKLNRDNLVKDRRQAADELLLRLNSMPGKKQLAALKNELFSPGNVVKYVALQRAVFKKWELSQSAGPKKEIGELKLERQFKSVQIDRELLEIAKEPPHALLYSRHFSISSVEISNFKTIDYIKLDMLQGEFSDRESWLLLLGDNGIGKSSILQAIALTLCGRGQLERLPVVADEMLKDGQKEGYVKVFSYEQDEPVTLTFDSKGFQTAVDEPLCFLLAYGATRLLPKGNFNSNIYLEDYLNIGNLFDYTVALSDVHAWLSAVLPDEFERIASALFDLLDLKPGQKLVMEHQKLAIRSFDHTFPVERSSDGYQSMVALACDIMKTLSLENASYHSTQGIVMIDELGNHLHPRWRMKIVSALKNAFPLLQFIVSSHEPLCLRGLLHGEVAVLLRDAKNRVRALDKNLLPDHNKLKVDQLLTSDLFGLINTLDPETEQKYENYYALLAKPEAERNGEERQQVASLGKELANTDMIGPTPQMQVLYQVVNETYAKNLREDGFKTRTELKQETVEAVKSILDEKGLDWL